MNRSTGSRAPRSKASPSGSVSRSSSTRTCRSGVRAAGLLLARPRRHGRRLRRRVALGLVPAVVLAGVRAADLRLRDDAVAPQAAKVLERLPAAVRVLLEEFGHPLLERPDHVRADRVV